MKKNLLLIGFGGLVFSATSFAAIATANNGTEAVGPAQNVQVSGKITINDQTGDNLEVTGFNTNGTTHPVVYQHFTKNSDNNYSYEVQYPINQTGSFAVYAQPKGSMGDTPACLFNFYSTSTSNASITGNTVEIPSNGKTYRVICSQGANQDLTVTLENA